MIVNLIGGVGLFLLGMLLMTDGLKAVAGDALRRILSRFVRGPFTAMTSGAVSTALIQSSSATTLTTIGFVSAGLITFPQAVGVIFGANLGTTSTGWIVSLLGLKLDISIVTLPMIGVGAMMRLLGRGAWAHAGMALAGFGLIFVGIDSLQESMAGLAERFDLARFSDDTVTTRLLLVLIGAAMTVVMQSSSAAVATTLAALHGGAIGLEQAGALVIGQNIGTTVKVLLVSIGASVPVKRTALAHILFNLVTGLVALLLLSPFVWLVSEFGEFWEPSPGVLTLAAFHTAFNLLGIAIFLPWLGAFANLVARIIPERGSALTRRLDRAVTDVPAVAVEAARRTVMDVAALVTAAACRRVADANRDAAIASDLTEAEHALAEVTRFLGRVQTGGASASDHNRAHLVHLAILHAVDHQTRLIGALKETHKAGVAGGEPTLHELGDSLSEATAPLRSWLAGEARDQVAPEAQAMSQAIAERRRALRPLILERTAGGNLSPDAALSQLEALQWIDRIGYHIWRTVHHLEQAEKTTQGASQAVPPELEPMSP